MKVVGRAGAWVITGVEGLRLELAAKTVEDAVRMARRKIGFHPVVFRQIESAKPSKTKASATP
ncbi:MAG: hypothetical protein K1X53_11165 [Candidatus Sumerlaeaceae bacterium]|nr:hypothetical protein [Candidatus Sumerlaeaceae bacterium]